MKPTYLVTTLVVLALTMPATPAHAGGIVSVCDEAHLLAALHGDLFLQRHDHLDRHHPYGG